MFTWRLWLLIFNNKNTNYKLVLFEGGPLEQGDIEELGDQLYIVCPWHSFDFNLNTGLSSNYLELFINP